MGINPIQGAPDRLVAIRMTKKRAIGILKDIRSEIDMLPPADTLPTAEHRTWLRKVKSYADKLFLIGSEEHDLLAHTSFTIYSNIELLRGTSRGEQQNEVNEEAKRKIDHCIDHLDKFGIYRLPTANVLASISNTWLGILAPLLITALFYAGHFFGSRTNDIRMSEMQLKSIQMIKMNSDLIDSLSVAAATIQLFREGMSNSEPMKEPNPENVINESGLNKKANS